MWCLSLSLMSTNPAGFLAFAKRITMCCLSLSLMSTNVAGLLDSANVSPRVVYLEASCLQRQQDFWLSQNGITMCWISGFCKTYHHLLSIFKSHVYKRGRLLDFAKRITMCCLSLSLMSRNVAEFLAFAKGTAMCYLF